MVLRDSEVAKALRTYLVKLDNFAKEKAPRLVNESLMETIGAYGLPLDYKGALIQLLKENGQLKTQIESAKGEINTLLQDNSDDILTMNPFPFLENLFSWSDRYDLKFAVMPGRGLRYVEIAGQRRGVSRRDESIPLAFYYTLQVCCPRKRNSFLYLPMYKRQG